MRSERDMALYTLSVPRQVGWLRPARNWARRWLRGASVRPDVLDSVVWVLDAALSSAIDHLRRHPRADDGSRAEFVLHVDDDVVVLTAVDRFSWCPDTIAADGEQAQEWRTVAAHADRVTLDGTGDSDPDAATTFTAYFSRDADRID